MSMEKRDYYRIEESLPMIYKKLDKNGANLKSRIISGYSSSILLPLEENTHDNDESMIEPKFWRLLNEINYKMDLILNKFNVDIEELNKADVQKVNISEGGIKFYTDKKYEIGDIIEIKILLTTYPFKGLALYGELTRLKNIEKEKYEAAIKFFNFESDVEKVLIQYIIHRQRETLRKQKKK